MQAKRLSILLSQNDARNRELASEVLSEEGWDVLAVGPPTLDLVRAHAPQAIVLDGHGAAFLGELRASPAFARTPVVLWTAQPLEVEAIAALEQEFAPLAVVQKPSLIPELPDAIRRLVASAPVNDPGRAAS